MQGVEALLAPGDVDGALAFHHPEVEWRFLDAEPLWPDGGRGIESLRKWISLSAENTSEDAEEAGMALFEERHGDRPRYHFTSIYIDAPNRPGPHIRGMP